MKEKLSKDQSELIENVKQEVELDMLEISKVLEKFQKDFDDAFSAMQESLDKLKKQIFA